VISKLSVTILESSVLMIGRASLPALSSKLPQPVVGFGAEGLPCFSQTPFLQSQVSSSVEKRRARIRPIRIMANKERKYTFLFFIKYF